ALQKALELAKAEDGERKTESGKEEKQGANSPSSVLHPPSFSLAGVLVYLAAAEYAIGNYLAAAEALTQALQEDPDNARLHILAGRVWEAAGQPGVALAAYREAANLLKAAAWGDSAATVPTEVMAACQLGLARSYRLAEHLTEADNYLQAA